jgi:hypothetical protein
VKRVGVIAFLVLVLVLAVLWLGPQLLERSRPGASTSSLANPSVATNTKVTESFPTSQAPDSNKPPQLLGETILRDYGNTNLPPQNDLTLMARLIENSLLLSKSAANRPLSANEDWADFFLGKNAAHERFLPAKHPSLNANGQLIDRWDTPLFFHASGAGRYEIRSAGPDKHLWTDDDIHRNPDNSFRRGADLNPVSLFPATNK